MNNIIINIQAVTNHEVSKFWKQFTTVLINGSWFGVLWLITKLVNFESNSQQAIAPIDGQVGCD